MAESAAEASTEAAEATEGEQAEDDQTGATPNRQAPSRARLLLDRDQERRRRRKNGQ